MICDKIGQGSVSMCGFIGEYILLLIDGCCQNNYGDIYLNNFGGNVFNYLLLLDIIECIEVICGLVFILYGVDVLGGVINVIIKKYCNDWGGNIIFGCSV